MQLMGFKLKLMAYFLYQMTKTLLSINVHILLFDLQLPDYLVLTLTNPD